MKVVVTRESLMVNVGRGEFKTCSRLRLSCPLKIKILGDSVLCLGTLILTTYLIVLYNVDSKEIFEYKSLVGVSYKVD